MFSRECSDEFLNGSKIQRTTSKNCHRYPENPQIIRIFSEMFSIIILLIFPVDLPQIPTARFIPEFAKKFVKGFFQETAHEIFEKFQLSSFQLFFWPYGLFHAWFVAEIASKIPPGCQDIYQELFQKSFNKFNQRFLNKFLNIFCLKVSSTFQLRILSTFLTNNCRVMSQVKSTFMDFSNCLHQ